MTDQYTEVSTQGYFSRLAGSFVGVLIGIVLLIAGAILLYWNEGRAVDALVALDRGAKQVVAIDADKVEAANDGKLVYLRGDLATRDGARDPLFNVAGNGLIRVKRDVEMYQWREETHSESQSHVGGSKTTTTTYTYTKEWSSTPIRSSAFHHPEGHANPSMAVNSAFFDARDAKLGAYRLGASVLSRMSAFTPLDPGTASLPPGYQRDGDGLYRGVDPANPAVGDLRVHFAGLQPQAYSVVAGLASGTLSGYRGARDYEIALAEPGVVSSEQLFKAQEHSEKIVTWILRAVGFVVIFIGLVLIAQPIATVLAFLPFFENIAEAGIFLMAVMLAVPLTLLIVAVAWLAHRPLIGAVLIAAAAASAFVFPRVRRAAPTRPQS
jgi:hypothetical protein